MQLMREGRHMVARILRRLPFYTTLRQRIRLRDDVDFRSSDQYWNERYAKGGNSGEGSYGKLARYKASVIDEFCDDHGITSAIEFGCGDGSQMSLFDFERYIGVDISAKCIAKAREKFGRKGWEFHVADDYRAVGSPKAELGLSLDVIYHLVEDEVYHRYLDDLFQAATRYVLVYTSNFDKYDPAIPHVKHRPVVDDVATRIEGWRFVKTLPNPFGRDSDQTTYGSFADFHIFEKSE